MNSTVLRANPSNCSPRATWSMMATSPGWILLRRFLVRLSTRARPVMGRARRDRSRRRLLDFDVDVGVPSVKIVVDLRPEREHTGPPDHGKGSEHTVPAPDAELPQVDRDDPKVRVRRWFDRHAEVPVPAVEPVA